ncbi:MAG: hypothetical protein WA871_11715 [Candidatus Acidiferrales bacterium]
MRRFAALVLASSLVACPAMWAAGDSGSGAKAGAASDPSSNSAGNSSSNSSSNAASNSSSNAAGNESANSSGATSGTVTKSPAASPAPASTPASAATWPASPVVSPAPTSAELQNEIEQMKVLMQEQAAQINEQQREIAAMKTAMPGASASAQPSAQVASPSASRPAETMSAASAPPSQPAINLPAEVPPAAATAAVTPAAKPAANSAATLAADGAPAQQHSPLGFKIGDATFTPLGFLDLTDVFRTTGTGAGIGSSFGSIPYNNSLPMAGLTEDRFSAQNSRVGMRIDAPVGSGTVTGYIEADFLGITAANANITSNSNTFRMRNYFVDYRRGEFEFLAGQDWSLLTPNRKGLSPYPSDIFYSQDMDTNYQVGLTWARQPQIRFIYHPNDTWAMGFSIENADQLVGGAATTPSAFSGVVGAVDTTSGGTLSTPPTPNVAPDFIFKIAADPKVGNTNWHFDFAGLLSEFKLVTPATVIGGTSRTTDTAPAGGFEANANLELVKNFHWIGTAFWSDGGGRYIDGLGPDLVVSQASTTSPFLPVPLKAGSAITGFEWQVTPKTMFYGYYGGAYYGQSFSQDPSSTTTKLVGYGFTGGANTQNRSVQEGTIGWVQTFFKSPNYGAFSLITQASYLTRDPWFVATGAPKDAHLVMGYVDLRYTLP